MDEFNELVRLLDSREETERLRAAQYLAHNDRAERIEPLLERLEREESHAVRDAICHALAIADDPSVSPGLLRLLESEDSWPRNHAIQILRERREDSIEALKELIRHPDRDLRKFAIDIVGPLTGAMADRLIATALNDEDLVVAISAVENIGENRRFAFKTEALAMALSAEHPMLIVTCLESLAKIGDEGALRALRSRYPVLEEIPDPVRPSFLRVVGSFGTPADYGELASLVTNDLEYLLAPLIDSIASIQDRHPSEKLHPSLKKALWKAFESEAGRSTRYRILGLLAHDRPDDEETARFVDLLSETDLMMRWAALRALMRSGTREAKAILTKHWSHDSDSDIVAMIESRLPVRGAS